MLNPLKVTHSEKKDTLKMNSLISFIPSVKIENEKKKHNQTLPIQM